MEDRSTISFHLYCLPPLSACSLFFLIYFSFWRTSHNAFWFWSLLLPAPPTSSQPTSGQQRLSKTTQTNKKKSRASYGLPFGELLTNSHQGIILDKKSLLLKIPPTRVTEHGEIKRILTWKPHLYWLAFTVQESAMHCQSRKAILSLTPLWIDHATMGCLWPHVHSGLTWYLSGPAPFYKTAVRMTLLAALRTLHDVQIPKSVSWRCLVQEKISHSWLSC